MGHHQPCRAFGTWVSGPGKRTQGGDFAGIGESRRAQGDRHRADHGGSHSCSSQSNWDRAALFASSGSKRSRIASRSSNSRRPYGTGVVIPIDDALVRR